MRVGKRANVVEAKRTRSCVVRLENISSPPYKAGKIARTIGVNPRTHMQSNSDEKKDKGLVKKRPTIQGQNASTSSKTSGTPNTTQSRSRVLSTPYASQTSKSKYSSPNATQTSKSGTPNSAQSTKSKSGTPNSAQTTRYIAQNAAQAASKPAASKSIQTSSSKSKDAAKDTFKPPLKASKSEPTKTVVTPAPTLPTSTIATGRSRRAIKPNPKYASEDIVTPKMIRNVGAIYATGGTASKKSTSVTKQRKPSTSSSDDFFNDDSNDESYKEDLEDELDKMYRAIAKDSDSDFSDESKIVTTRPIKRVKQQPQQRKTPIGTPNASITPRPTASTTPRPTVTTTPRPTSTVAQKSQPSQLQLLRKSFAANVNRSIEPIAGVKRARNDLDSSDNDADVSGIARKRFLLAKSSSNVASGRDNKQQQQHNKNSNSSEITMLMRKTNQQQQQTLNGSKIIKLKTDGLALLEEPKRNTTTRIIEKRTLMDGNSVTLRMAQQPRFLQTVRSNNSNIKTTAKSSTQTSTSTTRTLITMPMKTQHARSLSLPKRRSASPAITKPIPKSTVERKSTNESIEENKAIEAEPLSTTIEDFETMPTFTIVNINDIINKKGDVLISKSDKIQKLDDSDMSDDYDLAENRKTDDYSPVKPEGRKVVPPIKKASGDVRQPRSPMTTSTTKKPPTPKILNHILTKKSSPTNPNSSPNSNKVNSSISSDKPAPRILNSVVAKKTQPVKPMIANFDDSDNEDSYQFSLDGDEDMGGLDEDKDDTNDPTGISEDNVANDDDGEDDNDPRDSFNLGKHKLPTSTPYTTKKKALAQTKPAQQPPPTKPPQQPPPPQSTKENSQSAVNRQITATKNIEQRKPTPEKVVISRQGDKVIKKITCFETWYVIVPNEVKPSKLVTPRNVLEIPLIRLANLATDIKLPNSDWKGKVTLHELSPTMLAKTNLTLYTGDLKEFNIAESERGRYQPSCVMFRRTVNDRTKSRLPYDRAVIFKNRTFFTNIEGKNVKLVGAPSTVSSQKDVEILLQIIDSLTLQSTFVEPTNAIQ
ncbi:serine-rich adhesin for platelets [Eurosta solidaginis]|uniref:serine-rich adhesin for platelets n=1 Tax=Eurosta solidaginis TaxID=178769 RepID=UPI0035316174